MNLLDLLPTFRARRPEPKPYVPPPPPVYCDECGRTIETYRRHYGYDSQTGRHRVERFRACPAVGPSFVDQPHGYPDFEERHYITSWWGFSGGSWPVEDEE